MRTAPYDEDDFDDDDNDNDDDDDDDDICIMLKCLFVTFYPHLVFLAKFGYR